MTFKAYTNPDFTIVQKLLYLLITFAFLGISILIISGVSKLITPSSRNRNGRVERNFEDKVQRLFEMIIAGASVMSFSCAYVVINHIYDLVEKGVATDLTGTEQMLINMWSDGKDFVLLLLICLSCVINTLLDSVIIPLKRISRDEKATMRMLGMFYVIIILIFLDNIGDPSEYSPVMMYYLGLMIGRFVYFDASFSGFIHNMKNVILNLPYLALILALTGSLCFLGFKLGYFLERNYYIVGIFYAHLFMLACIFVIHLIWSLTHIRKNSDPQDYED